MKKTINFLTYILIICITLSTIVSPVFIVDAQDNVKHNITKYIPYEDFDNPDLTYEEKVNKAHTIYWVDGINPPAMPNMIETPTSVKTKGEFKIIDYTTGNIVNRFEDVKPDSAGNIYPTFVSEYYPNAHWYDTTKASHDDPPDYNYEGINDQDSCWAAATANIIQLWMDNNKNEILRYIELIRNNPNLKSEGLADPSMLNNFFIDEFTSENTDDALKVKNNPIYAHMRHAFNESMHGIPGAFPDYAIDFFFNGYKIFDGQTGRNNVASFNKDANGGFFNPVFGKQLVSGRTQDYASYKFLNKKLKEWINNDMLITVGYILGANGHAISLWGAEYDENNKICALYITDSNDGGAYFGYKGHHNKKISMIRYRAVQDERGYLSITNQENPDKRVYNPIYHVMLLYQGKDELKYFNDNMKPLAKEGNYFPDDVLTMPPHVHKYLYKAEGNNIVEYCEDEDCSHRATLYIRLKDYDSTYTGNFIKPGYNVVVNGQWNGGYNYRVNYENNIDAGTGNVVLNYKGLKAKTPFKIDKATWLKPDAPIMTKNTYNSITLRADENTEYSINNGEFVDNPYFGNLEENKEYEFRARVKGDKNHNPSEASEISRFKTLKNDTSIPDYRVDFIAPGASYTHSLIVKENTTIDEPQTPKKLGYNFVGWYKDKEGKEKAVFPYTVLYNTKLYAKWNMTENARNKEYSINKITTDKSGSIKIPDNDFTLNINITNLSSSTLDKILLTAYDKLGLLVGIYSKNIVDDPFLLPYAGGEINVTIDIKNNNLINKLQAFIWTDDGNITPLANTFSIFK